jgi:hypothetical protein
LIAAIAFARRVPGMLSPSGWAAVAVLILFLGFGAYCAQKAAQGERDAHAAKAAKIERKASTARETAATDRLGDQAHLNQQRKALDDALAPLPDAVPSDRRIARHCLRLQRDGIDTSRLPECRRPDGQAPPRR